MDKGGISLKFVDLIIRYQNLVFLCFFKVNL